MYRNNSGLILLYSVTTAVAQMLNMLLSRHTHYLAGWLAILVWVLALALVVSAARRRNPALGLAGQCVLCFAVFIVSLVITFVFNYFTGWTTGQWTEIAAGYGVLMLVGMVLSFLVPLALKGCRLIMDILKS